MKTTSKAGVAKTPKLRASVFRKAASLIKPKGGWDDGCCWAISRAMKTDERTVYHDYLETVLKPKTPYRYLWWYNTEVDGRGNTQLARTLGLLLCELLVKEGFQP